MAIKVGFVGLGTMGKRMAANLIERGFDLMVYDVRREPVDDLARLGAKAARSAAEVGEHGEIIDIAVRSDVQAETALLEEDGVLAGAKPGTVVAIHSTIHPATIKKIAEQAQKKGVAVIDAEMSGGQEGAEGRKLCFMVGGDKAHLEKCRPVLEALGGAGIFHMGALGTAATTKLAQQVLTVGTMMAVTEGILLAKKAGIDPEAFVQAVHATYGHSDISDHWLDRLSKLSKDRVKALCKSLGPAFELAYELDVSLPHLGVAQQLLPQRMPMETWS